jgi:hypothetical protein
MTRVQYSRAQSRGWGGCGGGGGESPSTAGGGRVVIVPQINVGGYWGIVSPSNIEGGSKGGGHSPTVGIGPVGQRGGEAALMLPRPWVVGGWWAR